MYKITDITTLGTSYTVSDQKGNILKTIQIINHNDILEAAVGKYAEDQDSFESYLEKSISVLSGFESVDPEKIYWFSSFDEEIELADIIEYAYRNDYDTVILEHMDHIEE